MSEAIVRECAILNLNTYKRNPDQERPFDNGFDNDLYVLTVRNEEEDLKSLVIVFPGSESFGHWIHNFVEVFGMGYCETLNMVDFLKQPD